MKAKDLAALAALGVAGYAAYDKFSKKDEPKKKMGEGLEMSNQGAYERATIPKSANADVEMGTKGAYLPETPEYRTKGAYLDETPELRTKGAYLDERASPVAESRGREVLGREVRQPGQNWGGEGRKSGAAPAAKAASPVVEQPATSDTKAPRKFTPPGTQSSMGALSKATRPSGGATSTPSSASGNAAMAAFSQAKAVPRNIQYATEAEKARQKLIDEKNFDSDLMKSRRQAVVDTVKNIPANVVNAFTPPEKTFQNKTYVKDGKVVRYAKGGMVKKMSSGGMSSKPKPSTASSRGDGIAQRGKTRGQLR